MIDEPEPMAYIARKACGCFVFAGVDTPAAIQSRDQALVSARTEMAARVRLESQLGQAHEEIARLTEGLHLARRKLSIRGARKVIDAAIGKEDGQAPIQNRQSQNQNP
jgi:hypothetical protein